TRCPEEVQHGRVVPHGRVRHVDDDLRALERCVESLARDGVDACVRRCRERFVAVLAQLCDELRPDQAGPAVNDDLHLVPSRCLNASRWLAPLGLIVLHQELRSACRLASADTRAWTPVAATWRESATTSDSGWRLGGRDGCPAPRSLAL